MLETAAERVALLKAGVPGKCIEMRYIEDNGFEMLGENFYQPPLAVKLAMRARGGST